MVEKREAPYLLDDRVRVFQREERFSAAGARGADEREEEIGGLLEVSPRWWEVSEGPLVIMVEGASRHAHVHAGKPAPGSVSLVVDHNLVSMTLGERVITN